MEALRHRYTNCPICAGPTGELLGSYDCTNYPNFVEGLPRSITWIRCGSCGHIHTDSYWSSEGLRILLSRSHRIQLAAGEFEQKRSLWAPVVHVAFEHLNRPEFVFDSKATWLDVGCGDGALVMTASEFGFDAVGLDSRRESVERIRHLGYKAVEGDFLHAAISEPCDVISMADVLEHFAFPVEVLKKANSMLKQDGLLFVSCPNTETVSWKAMDMTSSNPYWIEMEHCHNFSRRLLMQLLRKCGFKPLRYGVSSRYKAGMEILAVRASAA